MTGKEGFVLGVIIREINRVFFIGRRPSAILSPRLKTTLGEY